METMEKVVYLDNAATTACAPEVLAVMTQALSGACGNPSSMGFEVTYIKPTPEGYIRPEDVEAAIRPDTALVSIMMANNEIGTIQPIKEITEIAHKHGVWMHTDAVQAVGTIPVARASGPRI